MDELLNSDIEYQSEDKYLFRISNGDVSFVIIEEEMEQLNDFCYLFLKETKSKIANIQNYLTEYEKHPRKVVDKELGITQGDLIQGLEDHVLPTWKDTYYFVARANCVLLLHLFTEKSLRTLCEYLCSNNIKKPKQIGGKSKIESYIYFLQTECSIPFVVKKDAYSLLIQSRKIRNAFAHGEWDGVRHLLQNIKLKTCFSIVTNLFNTIERSYENKLESNKNEYTAKT